MSVNVIIADDHPMFRVALRLGVQALQPAAGVVEVGSFDALKLAVTGEPAADLVLLDLMMPGAEGLSSLQYLRSHYPSLRVAVVSSVSEHAWPQLIQALGAVAFIHKSTSPEEMQQIFRCLLAGSDWWPAKSATPENTAADARPADPLSRLSRQELRILLHIKDGRLNKQIAADLGITESTVKTHISMILRKLDLQSRTQAAVLAQRLLAAPSSR
jgi:DNA-binding NarL/FixJ family response regulator